MKRARNSPLVYLQPGDGPATYADPNYRRLVENAIRWTASPEARAWARAELIDDCPPLLSLASGVLPEFGPVETVAAAIAAGWPAAAACGSSPPTGPTP